jgi:hypothetical protein
MVTAQRSGPTFSLDELDLFCAIGARTWRKYLRKAAAAAAATVSGHKFVMADGDADEDADDLLALPLLASASSSSPPLPVLSASASSPPPLFASASSSSLLFLSANWKLLRTARKSDVGLKSVMAGRFIVGRSIAEIHCCETG